MKSTNRLLAMLMVLVMIIGTMPIFASAALTDAFSDFPAGSWSEEAMTAAVNNGLLIGKGDGTIAPKDYLTRAEVATIINRAFGATVKADISRFTDVSADDWYYTEFQKAVNMQTVVGVDDSHINPTGYISRECVFTIMARALVLSAGDASALSKFSDASSVSSWATPYVAAMISNGYVNGDGNGSINPKAYITREEFAQILHNTIKTYITKDGEVSGTFEGNLLVRVPGVKLNNVTVNGDLIVGDGVGKGDLDLTNVKVTGRILFRGGEGKVTFDKTCSVGKFIIVHDVNGVVNFNNYRTEAVFDDIVLDTDATFLEKKTVGTTVRPSRPSGPSGTTTTYTITFDGVEYEVEEGKSIADAEDKDGNKLGDALEAAKNKEGYTFDFFHVKGDESKKITGAEDADSDIEIVGKWTIITYTITYDLGEGKDKATFDPTDKETYTVESEFDLPVPTWEKHVFQGWYEDAEFTSNQVSKIFKGTTGPKTFYAKWKEADPKTYTIIFNGVYYTATEGNTFGAAVDAYGNTLGDAMDAEAGRENTGFTFGFFHVKDNESKEIKASDIVIDGNEPNGNITDGMEIVAKWNEVVTPPPTPTEYTIIYDLGEATGLIDAIPNGSYTSEEGLTTLPVPEWDGHNFLGWYTAAGKKVTSIAVGETGDITLYAKWEENIIPTNALLGFEYEEDGDLIKIYVTLNKIPYDVDNLTDITLRYKQDPESGMTYIGTESLISGAVQAQDGYIAWYDTTPHTSLPDGGRIFVITYKKTASSVGNIIFSYEFTEICSEDGEATKYDKGTVLVPLGDKKAYRVNLYEGADTPVKGYYDVEANSYITQEQIDAVLTYNGAKGHTDSDGNPNLLYPELWYKVDGEWKIFVPDEVAITQNTDVYLLRRYISLKYTTDLEVKGIDIPDFIVTVPYDSDTYIGETVLDGLAAVRSTISRMLNMLEIQGVDAYQIALDKLAGLKLIDADGNILNVEVKVPLHKLISEQLIISTIDKYVDNNLNNEEFIVSILENEAVVNMLLEDEGIKISVLSDDSKLNTFLTDAKIKEMMGKDNIVDIIIKDEAFKAEFIKSDATFEYIIGDLKNLLNTKDYHDMIIDACVEYVIDVYFEETKTSKFLYDYIDDVLHGDAFISELEKKIEENPDLKDLFKEEVMARIEAVTQEGNEKLKEEIYAEIRDSQTIQKAIIRAVKSNTEIMDTLKNDIREDLKSTDSAYKDAVIKAVKAEFEKTNSTLKQSIIDEIKKDYNSTASSFKSDIIATVTAELNDKNSEIRKSVLDEIKSGTGSISDKVKDYVKNSDDYKAQIKASAKTWILDVDENDEYKNIATVKDKIKTAVKTNRNALVKAIINSGYVTGTDAETDAETVADKYLAGTDADLIADVNGQIDTYFVDDGNVASLINTNYNDVYDSIYADIFDDAYSTYINDGTNLVDAFDKYISDSNNLTTAIDLYVADDANLEKAVDKYIATDANLLSAVNTYIADNDKLNEIFSIYTADVDVEVDGKIEKDINPNLLSVFDAYIDKDANLDKAFNVFTSHETEFEKFYDDNLGANAPDNELFNMLFENYYEGHVHDVAKEAYDNPNLHDIVMDYVHDYTEELVVEYANGTLETNHPELVDEIDKLMHEDFPAEIRRQYFEEGSTIKTMVDEIIETEGVTVIRKYVAGDLDDATTSFIKTESDKQIRALIKQYTEGTISADKKQLIDNEINAYIKELIDDYISGDDRDTLGSLVPTYAKDAVDALKDTPEFKNTIADFTSGNGVRVNEGNVMFIEILADLLDDYSYDKIKAELLPERIVKMADIVGDDVIAKYVNALFDDFVGDMKSAVDNVNADIKNSIKGTEYKFSTTPSVLVEYMKDFVVNYYNKLYSKARAKVYEKADAIRLNDNTYAKQLVDYNWLSLFFDEGAPADTMRSGYKLKEEIIDYYDEALKQIILLHDAITWYGTRDDMSIEQKLDAASVLIGNFANKANNIIMNYIDNGELPKGYTKDEVISKLEGLYDTLVSKVSQFGKIEELYEAKEETINSYIDKAIELYREYGDRDYRDIIDLAGMSIYAEGKAYPIYQIILESSDEVFDFDDLCTAVFESTNYHGVSKIESAMAKIKSKMDQYSYTPTVNDTARYVRNAYKASVGPKTIKGKTTGTHAVELQRYLSYIN